MRRPPAMAATPAAPTAMPAIAPVPSLLPPLLEAAGDAEEPDPFVCEAADGGEDVMVSTVA